MMQGMKRGDIWDVVSSLAEALSEARDQLVYLINHDDDAKGSNRCHGTDNTRRSVGGVVNHSEDAVAMRCRGGGGGGGGCCGNHVPRNKNVRSVHRQHARGHVAFGNHSEFKPEPPSKPGKPVTMALHYSPPRGRSCGKPGASGLSINFLPQGAQYSCEKDGNCRSPRPSPNSYECKRHCIGDQYVALLREEACKVRERRLEKMCDNYNFKPKWGRC